MRKFINKIKSILMGNILYSVSQFMVLLVIIKIGSSYDLGVYTLVLSIITPINVFLGFQLRNQLAVDTKSKIVEDQVFYLRNILNILLIFISIIVYFLTNITLVIIFALFKIVESYYEIFFGLLLKKRSNNQMGKLLSLKSIGNLVAFSSTYFITKDLNIAVFTQVLFMLILISMFKHKKFNDLSLFKFKDLNKGSFNFLINTLPLAFSSLLISISPQIPRYFLAITDTVEAVGVFSTLSYIIVIGTLVVNSINSSFYNFHSSLVASHNYKIYFSEIGKNIIIYTSLWLIMIGGVLFFREDLLRVVFNETFTDYFIELIIILFGSIFLFISTLFINFTLFSGNYIYQLYIYILINIVSVIICSILIPQYGLIGASVSLLLTYLFQLLISLIVFTLIMRKRLEND